jgi:CRP-like cAMP-binding protein/serine/threonine protein kinase
MGCGTSRSLPIASGAALADGGVDAEGRHVLFAHPRGGSGAAAGAGGGAGAAGAGGGAAGARAQDLNGEKSSVSQSLLAASGSSVVDGGAALSDSGSRGSASRPGTAGAAAATVSSVAVVTTATASPSGRSGSAGSAGDGGIAVALRSKRRGIRVDGTSVALDEGPLTRRTVPKSPAQRE